MQSRPTEFRGLVQGTLKTMREEGTLALWKGWPATLTGMMMENATAFGVNEQLKRIFPEPTEGSTAHRYAHGFAMGGITGVFTSVALVPAENVKIKTQYAVACPETGRVPTVGETLGAVLRKQGVVRGLFNGLDAQIARDVPFYMVFFGGYELSRAALEPYMPPEAATFVAGGLAGVVGWACVIPLDSPKSVVHAGWDYRVVGDFPRALGHVLRTRGVRGLYTGILPAMLRAFPANAALFLGYETTRDAVRHL